MDNSLILCYGNSGEHSEYTTRAEPDTESRRGTEAATRSSDWCSTQEDKQELNIKKYKKQDKMML